MSCHIKKNINLLIGTDYPELPINIVEMEDLSSFEMDVLDAYEQSIIKLTEGDGISVSTDGIVVLLSRLTGESEGNYYYNLYTRYKGKKILAVYGQIKITTKPFCQDLIDEPYTITSEDIAIHLQLSIGYTEISQSVRFESLTPAQVESLRGPKGNPFTYADFTPAEIADLKQPAIDAAQVATDAADSANSAAGNANNAASAANSAVSNVNTAISDASAATSSANDAASLASTKAGEADTAATNANDAASAATTAATNVGTAISNANNAADNANTKATLANTAAGNANTATSAANTATTNANNAATAANSAANTANSAKGWTPMLNFEDVGGKLLCKLVDYTGGTGTKPTTNVGLYLSGSGYTSDTATALNFKGAAGTSVGAFLQPNAVDAQIVSAANPNNIYFTPKGS